MSKVVDFRKKVKESETQENVIINEDGTFESPELDELAMKWTFQFVDDLAEADIGGDTEEYCRDQAYFHEALKSLIYRCHGIEHPFHNIVDNNIRIEINEDGDFDAYWEPLDDEEEVDK